MSEFIDDKPKRYNHILNDKNNIRTLIFNKENESCARTETYVCKC